MYQELFSLRYQHEYFNEGSAFNLHCKLSSESNRLSMAMDAVLIVRQGGFRFLWNSARFSRQALLDNFSGHSIVIYLFPFDTEQFFNITDQFPVRYQSEKQAEGNTGKQDCLYLYLLHTGVFEGAHLNGISEPVEKLLRIHSIEETDQLSKVDLKDAPEKVQSDSEVKSLYEVARRKPTIVLVVPIDLLARDSLSEYQLLFQSKSAFFKYYFTSLDASQNLRIEAQQNKKETEQKVITFSRAEPYSSNGHRVPTFVSDSPIKLKRQPDLSYQLISETNGVEEVIFDALPQPNIQQYFKHDDPQQGPITVLEAFIK